ncbi:MAG: carbohydrate kinase family protein [Methanobacterium sp.]|uniref:carbohydrate kinase family protein n=1 Tax=Methanobacterium sp. TaxID=2164 RepID=UPI003D65D285|nr:carbohydrate kinase family protein [Methanobacterium sp.]
MKKIDVIGFGALNVDKLYNVNKIAYKDEEAFITDFSKFCGGSAANTIIGLSKLQIKTGFIGKIADDQDGRLLLENLQKENVNVDGIILSKNGRSGNVIGFVDEEGQRALYVDPGVNDLIKPDEVNLDYINQSKVLHLTSFVGGSIKVQEQLINEIPDNITVSIDPGRIYAERGLNFLKNILNRTNIILINEEELKHLTGKKNKTYKEGAETLLECGIDIVVVKMGDKGSYITNGMESYLINSFKVSCVDTTGAGDAFNAGFLYGFINGKNIVESGNIGNYVASCCIQESGAINGLPELSKLKNEMDNII